MSRPSLVRLAVLMLVLLGVGYAYAYRGDLDHAEVVNALAGPGSRTVDLDGMTLHYTDEGAGPAVLILHGSGADISGWQPFADALAARGFRVIAVDLPASGLSDPAPDGDYSIEAGVATAHAFLARLGVRPAAVIGHSTGGQIAWTAALEHPDTISRLVLLAPTGYPHPSPITWKLAQVPALGELMRHLTPRFLVRMNLEEAFHDDAMVTDALVDRYYTMIRREGVRDGLLGRMRAVTFDRHREVRCLSQPTLLIWGAEDAWLPPDIGGWFEAQISRARLVVLPETGHNIPEEAEPGALAATVAQWLAAPQGSPVERSSLHGACSVAS